MNYNQAEKLLAFYLGQDIPAFLWGKPGIGKSDMVKAASMATDMTLIDVRVSLLDPVDLRGLPHIAGDKVAWSVPSFLPDEKRDGKQGILFLDELNTGSMAVQQAALQLVWNRQLGEYKLPDGWRIIAAGNRQSDRAGVQRLSSALADRFAHIDVEPDIEAFKKWAHKNAIAPMVIAFVSFRPELLHVMEGSDLRAFPTPRSWATVSKVANAAEDIRFDLVTGIVGEGAAAEFEGFMRTWLHLPSIKNEVYPNPEKARLPDDPSGMYAMSTALAAHATWENFEASLTYVARLGREFEILTAVDAVKRDPALTETKAFVDWATRNQDVVL